MLAAEGEAAERLEIPHDAQVERLRRRSAALERQLEARIAQVEDLQRRLAEAERPGAAGEAEVAALRQEAERWRTEYEALMNTFTMRALRQPRRWYAAARRRLGGR